MTPRRAQLSTQGCTNRFVRPCVSFCRVRSGQAMLESLIVLILLIAGFFLFFDFTYDIVTRLLLHNGVARAARADTVGFNSFQRTKSYRVGMIPVSGERLKPEYERGVRGPVMELAYVRAYLASSTAAEAEGILDYERWKNLTHTISRNNDMIHVKGEFIIPKQLPQQFGALIGADAFGGQNKIKAQWSIEDHASYYLTR